MWPVSKFTPNAIAAPVGRVVGALEQPGVPGAAPEDPVRARRRIVGEEGRVQVGPALAGIPDRVELLDGRQPPVGVAAMVGGVQGGRNGHGRGPAHAVGVALLPGQPRDRVVDGEAVSAPGVAGLGAGELRVLAEEGSAGGRAGDRGRGVVAGRLLRIDERVRRAAADEPDVVVDADGVALGAAAVGEVRGIARLGIAALRAGPVDVQPGAERRVPRGRHVAHGPPEGDVDGAAAGGAAGSAALGHRGWCSVQ